MTVKLNDLIGKRFSMTGNGPDSYNCYNLCVEVSKRSGVVLPSYATVEDIMERARVINDGKSDYLKLDKPEPFCIVAFKIHPKFITHIGIVVEDCRRFIHVIKKCNVAIERLDSPRWRKRIEGYYKYVGK